MRLWTGSGDKGKTYLWAKLTSKASEIAEALGAVDELDSFVGLARANCSDKEIENFLIEVQKQIRVLAADLAGYKGAIKTAGFNAHQNSKNFDCSKKISELHVKYLENSMRAFESELPDLKNFILPGGAELAARLHVCRTVCRRAERACVRAGKKSKVNPLAVVYLNRLSSFFFGLALLANKRAGVEEMEWK